MEELEFYSPEEIEDMELCDFEVLGKSDFELIEDLATVSEIYESEMDPHLDHDKQAILAEAERRGLLVRQIDDDWKCQVCGDENSFDSEWCQGCGYVRGFHFDDE